MNGSNPLVLLVPQTDRDNALRVWRVIMLAMWVWAPKWDSKLCRPYRHTLEKWNAPNLGLFLPMGSRNLSTPGYHIGGGLRTAASSSLSTLSTTVCHGRGRSPNLVPPKYCIRRRAVLANMLGGNGKGRLTYLGLKGIQTIVSYNDRGLGLTDFWASLPGPNGHIYVLDELCCPPCILTPRFLFIDVSLMLSVVQRRCGATGPMQSSHDGSINLLEARGRLVPPSRIRSSSDLIGWTPRK